MSQQGRFTPLVLAIGGHDPSGAGIQADIETAAALGCHAATLVTCQTTQNTERVADVIPTPVATLLAQFELLVADWPAIACCKIGLVPSVDVARGLACLLRQLPPACAVVIDPVIAAGSGASFMDEALRRVVLEELWPLATVRTPNLHEAAALAATAGERAVEPWLARQTGWVLIKGADAATTDVHHRLEHDGREYASFTWPRLPGRYHGTGCTLATAIAAYVAHGCTMAAAVAAALDFTWQCLRDPLDFGGAQCLPRRALRGLR